MTGGNLLDLHPDPDRCRHGFSADIEAAHQALFDPGYSREYCAQILLEWIRGPKQPCRFAQLAAELGKLDIVLVDEAQMALPDEPLAELIATHRKRWLMRAFTGDSVGLVLLATGPILAYAQPDAALQAVALRLASSYCGRQVRADEVVLEDIYYRIDEANAETWRAPLNLFAVQACGRWWHERRIPGGIGFSINSVGHMIRVVSRERGLSEPELQRAALVMARQTIARCCGGPAGGIAELDRDDSNGSGYLASFDTDAAIPSALFARLEAQPRDRRFAFTTDFSSAEIVDPGTSWSSAGSRMRGGGRAVSCEDVPAGLYAEPSGDCRATGP